MARSVWLVIGAASVVSALVSILVSTLAIPVAVHALDAPGASRTPQRAAVAEAPAHAALDDQDGVTIAESSIALPAANRMLDAAEQRARELGAVQSFAIVDQARHLKAFRRMDGSRGNSIQTAQDKAYTAMTYGENTRELWERGRNNEAYILSITHQPHVYLTPGGVLIRSGGRVIGAIGVSGGRAGEDEPVAEAALAALPE